MRKCPHCGKSLVSSVTEFSARQRRHFEKFLDKQPNGCWLWTGYGNPDGYGRVNFSGKSMMAHRASFMMNRGEIPEGKILLHSCDQTRCCNPDHLRIGTPSENSLEMVSRGRCRAPAGSNNHQAVLDEAKATEIKLALSQKTESLKQLSVRFGLSLQSIYNVGIGKTWKHVLPELGAVIPRKFYRKLTRDDAKIIREKVLSGVATQADMAREYGLSQPFVSRIVNQRRHGDHMEEQHPISAPRPDVLVPVSSFVPA